MAVALSLLPPALEGLAVPDRGIAVGPGRERLLFGLVRLGRLLRDSDARGRRPHAEGAQDAERATAKRAQRPDGATRSGARTSRFLSHRSVRPLRESALGRVYRVETRFSEG
jgi:chorismate-pyruvate lyase